MADIIIPVYNGIEETRKCVESVLKYTDLKAHHLYLINDASPDEAVLPMLEKYAMDNAGITVINNEHNLGFPGTVNRGIRESKADVLLLNSDTIVTENWLDKIIRCAYSSKEIATVTPLSNAATLASVPETCVDNDLPVGYTVEKMARLVETVSIRKYPRVPVGVGFCFFIKRSVLDIVGLLDEEAYERGYGEENDFCHRATILGYVHVLCDDTFIYHSGTASFVPEQKKALVDAHAMILAQRYPLQVKLQNEYLVANPDEDIRARIRAMLAFDFDKKTIFYLSHMDFREDVDSAKGGVQYHIRDLKDNLKKDYNVLVGAKDGADLLLTIYSGDAVSEMRFPYTVDDRRTCFRNVELANIFKSILVCFDVMAVHVHHTKGLSLDIFYEAAALSIPVYATIHDYYFACPNIKLYRANGTFCEYQDNDRCIACLENTCGISALTDYKKVWQKEHFNALSCCSKLFIPSEAGKKYFTKAYPTLAEKCVVISHGVEEINSLLDLEPENKLQDMIMTAPFSDAVTKIDFACDRLYKNCIQGWSYIKGYEGKSSSVIVDIRFKDGRRITRRAYPQTRKDLADVFGAYMLKAGFKVLLSDEEIGKGGVAFLRTYHEMQDGKIFADKREVKIKLSSRKVDTTALNIAYIGGVTPEKGSAAALKMVKETVDENIKWYFIGDIREPELSEGKWKNVMGFSEYRRESLRDITSKLNIDLVVILPQWAETYCYTISEAVSLGLPVITTDIGAIGERVKGKDYAWLVSVENAAKESLEIIRNLKADAGRTELKRKKEAAINENFKSTAEMTSEYRAVYESGVVIDKTIDVQKCESTITQQQCTSLVLSACSYGEGLLSKNYSAALFEKVSKECADYKNELIKLSSSKGFGMYSALLNFARKVKRKLKR